MVSKTLQHIQHWSWQCVDFHTLNTLYIIFQDRELSLYCFHVCHFFSPKIVCDFCIFMITVIQSVGWSNVLLVWVSSNQTSWHILKFMSWYTIQHKFVPACSIERKTRFSRKLWLLYFADCWMISPHCICRHSHAPRSFNNWRQHGADNWKHFDHLALGLNFQALLYSVLLHFFVITFVADPGKFHQNGLKKVYLQIKE